MSAPVSSSSTGIPELRRCPFCGGEAERYDCHDTGSVNEGGSCIQCKACQASSPIHFDRKENLYSSWNDRTEPSSIATDLDDPRLYHYGTDPELRSAAAAQGQSDCGEPDLKFANEQNIKAARKYKARLDFMEAKYGAIDWEADVTAHPTQGGDKGEAVAFVPLTKDGRPQWAETFGADDGCYIDYPEKWRPLYASPQPTTAAYTEKEPFPAMAALLATLSVMKSAHSRGGGRLMSIWESDVKAVEAAVEALSIPSTQCQHAAIIGLDGKWHCQKCGDAIEMAVAHSSTHQTTEAK